MGYGLMNGFADDLYTPLRTTSNYSAMADFYTYKTLARAKYSQSSLVVSRQQILTQ
jgi:hypothetical protein